MEEGCTRRVLGDLYRAQSHLKEAEVELEQSLCILEELESPYEAARTTLALALLRADQGDETESGRLRQQAIAIFERLGADLDVAQARNPQDSS
jgi:hypothetical protein